MKKLISTIVSILSVVSISFSQTEEATTKTGKKIILNHDGTWKYAEEREIGVLSTSSDCLNYIETTEDKMTGAKTTASKSTIVVSTDGGKTGFGVLMLLGSRNSLIMSIHAVGADNCIDQGNKINILFTDGSKLELRTDGKFNCNGQATVYFGGVHGKKKQLQELRSKKIQTIRVWTSDSFVEKDFTLDNSEEFYHTINCLTKK